MEAPREILFKAKRKDNGEWVEGYYIYNEKHFIGHICIEHYIIPAIQWFEIDPTTLSQFTGLTDRNGNKIFENDIAYIFAEDGYFHLHWEKDLAQFIMENYDDRFSVDFDNYWSHEIEVYGNIFDNRELLFPEEIDWDEVYESEE